MRQNKEMKKMLAGLKSRVPAPFYFVEQQGADSGYWFEFGQGLIKAYNKKEAIEKWKKMLPVNDAYVTKRLKFIETVDKPSVKRAESLFKKNRYAFQKHKTIATNIGRTNRTELIKDVNRYYRGMYR